MSCDAISAKASYDQARNADRQILIGWIQAIVLGLSLLFSALATRAALKAGREAEKGAQASRDSVEEAKRSADAAEKSLRQSEMTHVAEVRPWISIQNVAVESRSEFSEPGSIDIMVRFKIENVGLNPAIALLFQTDIRVQSYPDYPDASSFFKSHFEHAPWFGAVIYSGKSLEEKNLHRVNTGGFYSVFIGISYRMPNSEKAFFTGRIYTVAAEGSTKTCMREIHFEQHKNLALTILDAEYGDVLI